MVPGGVYPGCGTGVVREGAIPGTSLDPPGPIFSHIPASGPYPRPYEGNSSTFNEVSEIRSRIGSRKVPE